MLADIDISIALNIFFLILNNVKINFRDREFNWISTTIEAFLTTKLAELVGKKKFAAVVFNLNNKTFVVFIATLVISFNLDIEVHSSCKPQMTFLVVKTLIVVPIEYTNFANVFSLEIAVKILEYIKIINQSIILVDSQ